MKTNHFSRLILVIFSLTAFASTGCAEKEQIVDVPSAPKKEVTPATATPAVSGPAVTFQPATTASPNDASAKWTNIEDCAYDMRAQFFAGLKGLEARVDDQFRELTAKRATMTSSTADTKDWDFAMKEMEDARSYLKSMDEELSKATPETWSQEKDKVGQAWVRTQEAYKKVKSSTTS
ncbi:MAG TPA: hypothetical protein VK717_10700 [Opitutaceae bacterium]|jgi:hypothetical protein|nr:hypothetical protein [Opitutaceae bacterium]